MAGVDWDDVSMLTPGMKNLGNQINVRFPHRAGTSDGAIGDYDHSQGTSGHNPDDTSHHNAEWDNDSDSKSEVRAIDVDKDLNDIRGASMQQVIDHIRKLKNLSSVLRYMIFNKKMYHVNDGFNPTTYTGSNPHSEHAHFSGAYSQSADGNTSFDYRLGEVGVGTQFNSEDRDILKSEATEGVLSYAGGGLPSWEGKPSGANFLNSFNVLFNMVAAIDDRLDTLEAKIDALSNNPVDIAQAVWAYPERSLTVEES